MLFRASYSLQMLWTPTVFEKGTKTEVASEGRVSCKPGTGVLCALCDITHRCVRTRFLLSRLWSAGCDAAGASAARRPQDEAGGGRGLGLCERDHDPDALPPERDHHLHLQTGTVTSSQCV